MFLFSRHEFGGVRHLPGVVLCEASPKIGCTADVALARVGETAEDVGVVHERQVL